MKVLIVIDETPFFHPSFLEGIIKNCDASIVGIARVTKVLPKSNIFRWLALHWYFLRPLELARLVAKKITLALLNLLSQFGLIRKFYSVKEIAKRYNIPSLNIEEDINRPHYLEWIRSKQPDIILSACSVIFKEELLQIPKIGCLNRHSGLLPKFGGLWPVFQAFRSGESLTGVTIHWMERRIDAGPALVQKSTPIQPNDTIFSLYERCFQLSIEAVLEAFHLVRSQNHRGVSSSETPSYFSFPTKEQWGEFRKRGGRFI